MGFRQMIFANGKVVVVIEPNIFIGGLSSLITNEDDLAVRLGISSTIISDFLNIGSDTQAIITEEYDIVNNAFQNAIYDGITYFIDEKALNIGQNVVSSKDFLHTIIFKNAIFAGLSAFNQVTALRHWEMWELQTFTDCYFTSGAQASTVFIAYFPKVTAFGTTGGNDSGVFPPNQYGFYNMYLNASIETANGGSEDGNIAAIRATGANITYIQNTIKPNNITGITIGNIYSSSIELIFIQPTSNNALKYYEIESNGVLSYSYITETSFAAKGLQSNTAYNIRIRAVDIYYNKGEWSSLVSATTNLTGRSFPVEQTGLIFNLNAENRDSYFFKSSEWVDLVGGKKLAVKSAYSHESLAVLTRQQTFLDVGIDIPLGSDVTFSVFTKVLNANAFPNPGFARTGSYFFIIQGANGLPWIRWGADILKPSSGETVPLNEDILLTYVVKSGEWAKIYYNGVEKFSITHTSTTPAFSFTSLFSQNAEAVIGMHKALQVYTVALTQSQIESNCNQLKSQFRK